MARRQGLKDLLATGLISWKLNSRAADQEIANLAKGSAHPSASRAEYSLNTPLLTDAVDVTLDAGATEDHLTVTGASEIRQAPLRPMPANSRSAAP